MGEIADPVLFKEEGNKHFQAREIDKAIECYTKSIKSCKDKKALAVIYRNTSVCFLKKAANNLIVLAREDADAERIFQNNGVPLLVQFIETGKPEMILAAIQTLSGMCTGHRARTSAIIHTVGIRKLCSIDNEEIVLATANLFQCVYDSLSGGDKRNYGKEEALVLDSSKDLKEILLALLEMITR